MHEVEMQEFSEEFAHCWRIAGHHIQKQFQGQISWLKAILNPPFLEHLSFRLGNQLFFVRIEDVDGRLDVPGSRRGLLSISDGCNGNPCIMPLSCRFGQWSPDAPGWGLMDARTGKPIDPGPLVTDEKIEMTNWELQDFAVQVVRHELEKCGRKLMSWQGNPEVDPSIWFVGDHGPEWVVVRTVRYPEKQAVPPRNWSVIAKECAHLGTTGHFASVSVANADELKAPLWRGHGMYTNYPGLVPPPTVR